MALDGHIDDIYNLHFSTVKSTLDHQSDPSTKSPKLTPINIIIIKSTKFSSTLDSSFYQSTLTVFFCLVMGVLNISNLPRPVFVCPFQCRGWTDPAPYAVY